MRAVNLPPCLTSTPRKREKPNPAGPGDLALRILLLIGSQELSTYERAAVKWLGRLMVERPELGFEEAAAALGDVAGLFGHEHGVSASRLALRLRGVRGDSSGREA